MSRTGMICHDMTLAILKDLCGSRDDLLFPELDEPLTLDETRAGRLAEDHHRHAPVEGRPQILRMRGSSSLVTWLLGKLSKAERMPRTTRSMAMLGWGLPCGK